MAPTFTSKALHRIVERAIPDPTHRPSRETLNLISQSCNGDLRSAINSLEMMCKSKGAGVLTRSGTGGVKRGKGSKGGKGGQGTGRLGSKEVRELLVPTRGSV
jgi:cell cycle checkpoint protein